MATITASILIGQPHQNHLGIIPSHHLFLSENDRPALILFEVNINNKENCGKTIWIPTLNNLLEDILLMISINVFKYKKLCDEFYKLFNKEKYNNIELLKQFSTEELDKIYRLNKNFLEKNNNFKITISVFEGSTLEAQLSKLEIYSMDIEICKTSYTRYYSAWKNNVFIKGQL